jgi:hypothetical protein
VAVNDIAAFDTAIKNVRKTVLDMLFPKKRVPLLQSIPTIASLTIIIWQLLNCSTLKNAKNIRGHFQKEFQNSLILSIPSAKEI